MKKKVYKVSYDVDVFVNALGIAAAEKVAIDYLITANAMKVSDVVTTTGLHKATATVVMPDAT